MVDSVTASLIEAQDKASALFDAVVASGMIQAGKLESEITAEIHTLARSRFGLRRHWHRRTVRSGPNTMLTYCDEPPDRRITEDDIVYLDFGPVFEEREADFGRTYALASDPLKHRPGWTNMTDDVTDTLLEVAMLLDTAQHSTVERQTDPSFLRASALVRHARRDQIERTTIWTPIWRRSAAMLKVPLPKCASLSAACCSV
jgi:hypothetical protein